MGALAHEIAIGLHGDRSPGVIAVAVELCSDVGTEGAVRSPGSILIPNLVAKVHPTAGEPLSFLKIYVPTGSKASASRHWRADSEAQSPTTVEAVTGAGVYSGRGGQRRAHKSRNTARRSAQRPAVKGPHIRLLGHAVSGQGQSANSGCDHIQDRAAYGFHRLHNRSGGLVVL